MTKIKNKQCTKTQKLKYENFKKLKVEKKLKPSLN